MVANFRRSKGYEYFVRAARRVADCVPEARFLAVGETDPEIERKARDLVRDLRLHDRFLFLGFRADIPSILRDLDVFVLSSTDEGLSIATIEAMAASKPVVVTRSGGPEEVVDDGRTGFLVPPADAEAIAARVIELLQNAELAGRLGRQAQAEAQSRFSLGRMLSEYQSLYEKCLKRN
jgi:glycosyltransferase involved in cell wall biosynthesis